jgi:chorismate--pyruvate lyase
MAHPRASAAAPTSVILIHPDSAPDPAWRPASDPRLGGLRGIRPWLLDEGSLTRRLQAQGGEFRVQRLQQGFARARASENRILGCDPRAMALVREVLLTLDGRPVVFARSVFPHHSLRGDLRHLRSLGGTSLGAILFRRRDMRRSPFQVTWLAGDGGYLPRDLPAQGPVWGRRSVFELGGRRLLVSEVFLPGFPPHPGGRSLERSQRGRTSAAIAATTQ